jgi:hypothetical protein
VGGESMKRIDDMQVRLSKIKTEMDVLKADTAQIEELIISYKSVIRGEISPCLLCIGCEKEDNHIGICEGLIWKQE